jgi:hypothetical protein
MEAAITILIAANIIAVSGLIIMYIIFRRWESKK